MMIKVYTKYNRNTAPHLVHMHDMHLDDEHTQWLIELKSSHRSTQITAAVKMNADNQSVPLNCHQL